MSVLYYLSYVGVFPQFVSTPLSKAFHECCNSKQSDELFIVMCTDMNLSRV